MYMVIPNDLTFALYASKDNNAPITFNQDMIETSIKRSLLEEKKNIVNRLNTYFSKINVCFIVNNNTNTNFKYSNLGILNIEKYDSIYITIGNRIIDFLLDKETKDLTKRCLLTIDKSYFLNLKSKPIDLENYSSFPTIDHYAKLLADKLDDHYDKLEIENLFTSYDGNKKLCDEFEEFKIYFDKFGSGLNLRAKFWTNQMKHDLRILNHFKRRTCDFLLMTDSFFYSEDFRFSLGNIDKLYENLPFIFPSE